MSKCYKKFGQNDVFYNQIKAHPESEFFIYNSAVYYNKLQRADKYKYFKAAIASLWRTGVKSKEALDALDTTTFAGLLPPRARQAR